MLILPMSFYFKVVQVWLSCLALEVSNVLPGLIFLSELFHLKNALVIHVAKLYVFIPMYFLWKMWIKYKNLNLVIEIL